MPNIKEIAERIGKQFVREMEGYSYFGSNPGIPEDDIADFAEALLAELAKGNEPVYQFRPECDNWIDCSPVFFESWRGEKRIVYPLPPTASQIEQETADACAKLCHDLYKDLNGDADCRKHWPRQLETNKTYAKAIRSGAWKEFK